MAEKKKAIGLVTLKRTRLSFPYLFEPDEGGTNDEGEVTKPKYRAAFLLPKPDGGSFLAARSIPARLRRMLWLGRLARNWFASSGWSRG